MSEFRKPDVFRRFRRPSIITLADRARDAAQWELAAHLYRKALRRNPNNPAIQVQYGHVLKELGRVAEAEAAYRQALAAASTVADGYLHLAHVLKLQNRPKQAQAAYLRSFLLDDSSPHALQELLKIGWPALHLAELSRLVKPEVDAEIEQPNNQAADISPEATDPAAAALPLWCRTDYHLPDPFREYLQERFGAAAATMVRTLMDIVSQYEDRVDDFAQSTDCTRLVTSLKRLAPRRTPNKPVDASIIIPVRGGLLFTLTCLHSILTVSSRYSFEIIIGDDDSLDETEAVLRSLGDIITHIRHPTNLGFVENCNAASASAGGRYLVFLNNDVIVLPGWLDELLDTFTEHRNVGMVGAKLLNNDGTLQEAGGIYWQDGSAWNFGRGNNPDMPEYNYLKEVDYCSGAVLAIPRTVWRQMRGFDPVFSPAYCEDADLAFRLRAAGLSVLYQPFAEVIHHEGRSHGRDTSQGIKSYQVANQAFLRERWISELTANHFANGKNVFKARDRSFDKCHILVVDHYVPQWDRDAGSRSTYQYLRLFVEQGFHVTLWPDNLYRDPIYIKKLQQLGIEIIYSHHYAGRFPEWMKENGRYLDYIFLSRPHIALKYIAAARSESSAPIFYFGHDLHWRRLQMEYELTRSEATLAQCTRTRELEEDICTQADVLIYFNRDECDFLAQRFPSKRVVEWPLYLLSGEEIERAKAQGPETRADPHHLLFVGGFAHPPNVDGLQWFIQDVFWRLRERDARFHLTIVGSNAPEEILSLESNAITVAGHVDDMTLFELYRTAGMAIVPLRYGGGMKGKVIESFANGIPLVSTSIGMQGIDQADRLAFIADASGCFVEQVIAAASDRATATSKVDAAIRFLEEKYSRDAAIRTLSKHVPELAGHVPELVDSD